jgi:hypothetical protein
MKLENKHFTPAEEGQFIPAKYGLGNRLFQLIVLFTNL